MSAEADAMVLLLRAARTDSMLRDAVIEAGRRLREASDEIERLRDVIARADKEISVIHDAIWHESVMGVGGTGFSILHENADPKSAQATIWRLHGLLRPELDPRSEGAE